MAQQAKQGFHFDGTFYDEGDPVPEEVASQVGDHVLTEAVDRSGSDTEVTGEQVEDAARALVAAGGYVSEEEAKRQAEEAVEEYRSREQAAYTSLAEQDAEFDPAGTGVKADAVKTYLEGLDRETVAGSAEYDRVVEAEKAGANRASAFPKG